MRSGECGQRWIESDNMEHGSHHSRASGTTSTRYRDPDDHPDHHPEICELQYSVTRVREKKTGALCEICSFFLCVFE